MLTQEDKVFMLSMFTQIQGIPTPNIYQAIRSGFPMLPPDDSVWTLNAPGGGEVNAQIISGLCAVGADGFHYQATTVPGNPVDALPGFDAACDEMPQAFFDPTDEVLAIIRWTLAGTPVSDWSNVKNIIVN